jgi:hypothetical protein
MESAAFRPGNSFLFADVQLERGPILDLVIDHLAFSLDGRWLAATSATGVGLKVIDAQSWRIAAEDSAYAGDSYGAAFAPDGSLYTIADDGKLRLLRCGSLSPDGK